jgi:hypothetical protein
MQGDHHKIVVKVWHNATYHDVVLNNETHKVLKNLFKSESVYYNPTPAEWEILALYRLDPSDNPRCIG